MDKINVFSEIGKLNSIILHRPGEELTNIVPSLMDELLFDEVPYLKNAQIEHDRFADILRDNGVEVHYIEKLAKESIVSDEIRKELIETFIDEASIRGLEEIKLVREYLESIKDDQKLIDKMIAGIRKEEIGLKSNSILSRKDSVREFYTTLPMPNLYFTRDTFALVGSGVCMNTMWSNVRQRESIFGDMIFKNHPAFKDNKPKYYYNKNSNYTLEGGDVIVLSNKIVAVGISQRTEGKAIVEFAKNLLSSDDGFEKVLCLALPISRSTMHLDTVFTMIDKDLFTVYPGIRGSLEILELTLQNGEIKIKELGKDIERVLSENLGTDGVTFIENGPRGMIDAEIEQWSDGYNTLAIGPREVVVYERNDAINELLYKNNVKLHKLVEGELSRGRGGPRCMSMPLNRDNYF